MYYQDKRIGILFWYVTCTCNLKKIKRSFHFIVDKVVQGAMCRNILVICSHTTRIIERKPLDYFRLVLHADILNLITASQK